jgi:hypothetical protein
VAVTGQGRPLSVSAIPITPGTLSSGKDARCRDDWTFDFAGLLGREVFRIVKAPAGWTLGAIKLRDCVAKAAAARAVADEARVTGIPQPTPPRAERNGSAAPTSFSMPSELVRP